MNHTKQHKTNNKARGHKKVAKKSVHTHQKRKVSQRTLPGANALLADRTPLHLAHQEHGRDISKLQTHEDQYLLSSILEPNTYIPKMILSNNLPQAQAHTRSFYRKILRILPALCKQYGMLELNPRELVPVIRAHFKKHGNVTSPQVMDALRWEAEVEFSDVVRMFFTQSNAFSALFPDMHHASLPKLPTAAAHKDTQAEAMAIFVENSSPFLQQFIDPSIPNREQRAKLPSYNNV